MAIAFKDFHGKFLQNCGCVFESEIEPIGKAVELANLWIKECSAKIISIETVLINLNRGSEESLQFEGGENRNRNTQIVRVWYAV